MDAPSRAPVRVPVEVVDELFRFNAPEIPEAAFALRDDDAFVIAHTDGKSWAIDAIDRGGNRMWTRPLRGGLVGLAAFPGNRVAVFTRNPGGNDTDLAVVDPNGDMVATGSFASLTGTACTKGNRYWLARVGTEVVAQVVCGSSWKRVWFDAELRAVRQTTDVGYGPMYTAQAYIDDRGSEIALVRGGQRTVLAPRNKLGTIAGPQLAEVRDGVVAMLSVDEYRNATQRPRFSSRAIVSRHGARPWSVDLVPAHLSDDPPTLTAIASTRDDDVFVAIAHGNDGRLVGVELPAPRPTADTRFPGLDRAMAIAELDGASGSIKRVLALRPRTAWHVQPWSALAVSANHIVVANGHDVFVFARSGHRVVPAAASPTTPPPIATPLTAPAVSRVQAAWARVCGPRIAQKRNAPCRIEAVAVGKDGTIVIGGGYYEANQLDTVKLPKRAFETAVLAAFAPDGTLRWTITPGVSWHNVFSQMFVRDDGSIVALGRHGQGFIVDGKRLPERTVTQYADGSDGGFEANTPFLAILDRDGHAQLVDDADALLFGDRSTDPKRVCATTVSLDGDDLWLRGDCVDGTRRVRIRGGAASPAKLVPLRPSGSWPPALDARGTLVDTASTETTTFLLTDDLARPRTIPLFAGRTTLRHIATTAAGTWVAASVPSVSASAWQTSIQLAFVARGGAVTVRELASIAGSHVDVAALAVDEAGRPVVAIRYRQGFVLGGVNIPAPEEPNGNLFVRLTADGAAIDRVIQPAAAPRSCAHPESGQIYALAASRDRLAVVFGFGVDDTCNVKDEPSTLALFDVR